jgi:hypothetical protein
VHQCLLRFERAEATHHKEWKGKWKRESRLNNCFGGRSWWRWWSVTN